MAKKRSLTPENFPVVFTIINVEDTKTWNRVQFTDIIPLHYYYYLDVILNGILIIYILHKTDSHIYYVIEYAHSGPDWFPRTHRIRHVSNIVIEDSETVNNIGNGLYFDTAFERYVGETNIRLPPDEVLPPKRIVDAFRYRDAPMITCLGLPVVRNIARQIVPHTLGAWFPRSIADFWRTTR